MTLRERLRRWERGCRHAKTPLLDRLQIDDDVRLAACMRCGNTALLVHVPDPSP